MGEKVASCQSDFVSNFVNLIFYQTHKSSERLGQEPLMQRTLGARGGEWDFVVLGAWLIRILMTQDMWVLIRWILMGGGVVSLAD